MKIILTYLLIHDARRFIEWTSSRKLGSGFFVSVLLSLYLFLTALHSLLVIFPLSFLELVLFYLAIFFSPFDSFSVRGERIKRIRKMNKILDCNSLLYDRYSLSNREKLLHAYVLRVSPLDENCDVSFIALSSYNNIMVKDVERCRINKKEKLFYVC